MEEVVGCKRPLRHRRGGRFFSFPIQPKRVDAVFMKEDPRIELARVKEQLRRIRQVVDLHRKLGEDTSFELRELRRKIVRVKANLIQFSLHYRRLSELALATGSEDAKQLVEACNEVIAKLGKSVSEL